MTEEKKLSETAELAIARLEGVKPQLVAISRSHYGLYHRLLKHINCAILEIKQLEGLAPVVEQKVEDDVKKQVPKETGANETTTEGNSDDSKQEGDKQEGEPTAATSNEGSTTPEPKPIAGEPRSAAGDSNAAAGNSLKDKLAASKNKK